MRYFPLYEAKMFHQFDHRWATFAGADAGVADEDEPELLEGDEEEGEGGGDKAKTRECTLAEKQDPRYLPTPRYWVSEYDVLMRAVPLSREEKQQLEAMDPERVVALLRPRAPKWLIAFRNIARSTDERTAIFSVLPLVGCGNSAPILATAHGGKLDVLFEAVLSSLVTDVVCRCKLGGTNFNAFYLEQIGILAPDQIPDREGEIVAALALELVYTSEHLRPLAEACGYGGDPFPYDEDRRAVLRAELDALVARLYGLNRKQLRYILCPQGLSWAELENINDGWEDPTCSGPHSLPAEPALDFPGETFRVLKEKEEKKYGEYRTRRLVLEAWDRLWKELGPVEPLPVRFGPNAEEAASRQAAKGAENLGGLAALREPETGPLSTEPVSTGLFAEVKEVQTSQPPDFELVSPEPKPPTPLKDKQGRIIRVRVLSAAGQEIVAAGTMVGRRKQGEAEEWAVLDDKTNAVRKFLSPPATLKRLKANE